MLKTVSKARLMTADRKLFKALAKILMKSGIQWLGDHKKESQGTTQHQGGGE